MEECGYSYSPCYCDGRVPTLSPRCGNVSACHSDENPTGFICSSCSSVTVMGDQCDKSVMFFGLTSIAIISLTSLVGALVAPFQNAAFYANFQSFMIAVAIGCLTGDAILHLIPLIFGLHGHAHGKTNEGDSEVVTVRDGIGLSSMTVYQKSKLFQTSQSALTQQIASQAEALASDVVLKRGLMIMGGLYIFYLLETCLGMYQTYKQARSRKQASSVGDDQVGTTTVNFIN